MHLSIESMLKEIGYTTVYAPKITREEILSCIPNFEGLIIRSKTTIDKELLDKANSLKFIGRAGAGLDQIDVLEVEKKGIHLVNAPEGNRDALGEHAMGLLLSLTNNIVKANQEVTNFIWDREGNRGSEISNLTIGLFGYGNMAQSFAKRLKSFGCKILAYDKYRSNYSDEYTQQASLEQIQQEADVLSLHTPLTNETKAFINLDFLNHFKKNIWLINTSRGEIVPVKDTLTLLNNGKIKGASLDVLEKEKFNTLSKGEKETYNELFQLTNVIITPHIAGWSFESYQKINHVLTEKIKNLK